MRVFTTASIGTIVKYKLEGMGQTEIDVLTTVSNEWETLTWDFTGTPANFNTIVFMFDFGNVGNGSATSTFLFDDVEQFSDGQAQIDWPVDFESTTVNYTMTDFDGPVSTLTSDPENAANHVIRTIKTVGSGASSGTTIGRQSGFATNLPLSLSTPKMTVRVWSPNAGTPVRLKVENSSNAAQTCETQTNTTLAGAWETLEFNFANEAPGTAALSFGLTNGWVYNKASIFFNFGTAGATSGERTYYFDDVRFDATPVGVNDYAPIAYKVFPNPSHDYWTIVTEKEAINEIMLFGVQGQLITRLAPNATTAQVEASSLGKGVYIIHVSTDSGTSNVKVVKN